MNRCLQETDMLQWMTKGKISVIQKDLRKGPHNNYKPITCLPMMWEILTAQIREEINELLSHGLFLEEQKVCCKWTRGTGELLYINQHIIKGNKIQ